MYVRFCILGFFASDSNTPFEPPAMIRQYSHLLCCAISAFNPHFLLGGVNVECRGFVYDSLLKPIKRHPFRVVGVTCLMDPFSES